ncbi:MAG TPA: triphosphoribosyl-dephospho-CoA synthase [Schlesneria sp.]|jgi:triphosphoribosyl-dephospho-CoA synthase
MNLAEQIEISCLMEATARKPGNVHPGASFADLDYDDFVCAAQAVGQPLAAVQQVSLGQSVLNAIVATQRDARSNVNLGIALLIAPLAAVPPNEPLQSEIGEILAKTTVDDAEHVYAAIRLAVPGGLGKADSQDVHDRPTITLRDAMALAAERDRIAEQYSTDFAYVLGIARPWLVESWRWCHELNNVIPQMGELLGLPGITSWEAALIRFQLKLLADAPDSLVARKCGSSVAAELQQRAADVHHLDWPSRKESWPALHRFDRWLREDGHRRNPGTTADLVAATLFAAIRDGLLQAPSREAVLQHADHIRQSSATRVQHDY